MLPEERSQVAVNLCVGLDRQSEREAIPNRDVEPQPELIAIAESLCLLADDELAVCNVSEQNPARLPSTCWNHTGTIIFS